MQETRFPAHARPGRGLSETGVLMQIGQLTSVETTQLADATRRFLRYPGLQTGHSLLLTLDETVYWLGEGGG